SLVGLWLYQRGLRQSSKWVSVGGRGARNKLMELKRRYKVLTAAIIIVFGFLTTALPYIALSLRAFNKSRKFGEYNLSLDILMGVVSRPEFKLAVTNSVLVSFATAIVCVIIGLLTAYSTERIRFRGSTWLNSVAMSPLAVPGIV